jgi:hypothetical protein
MQAGVIDELAGAVSQAEEEKESFREFARGMIQQHGALYPRLHARVAQRREELAESAASATPANGRSYPRSAGRDDLFAEYARPLLDAAGEEQPAIERALRLATLFSLAAQEPLGNRAAALATLRDRLPQEDRAYFDETAPMMMRRYRELFAGGTPGPEEASAEIAAADGPEPRAAEPVDASEGDSSLDAPAPEAAAQEDRESAAEPAKRSRLGGIFRRGG